MKKVGFFTWQPSLYKKNKTSAGGGLWTRYLLDALKAQGYEVSWLAGPPVASTVKATEDVDIAIICWRWEMPDYPERHQLYLEQKAWLRKFKRKGIPVIVHDEDHKISSNDLKYLKSMGALLTAPEMLPREGFETLHFPNPHRRRLISSFSRLPFMTGTHFLYVGNSYERYEQVKQYVGPISARYKTVFFGNWLENGPGKPGKKTVLEELPHVSFRGRLSEKAVLENLMMGNITMHFFKPSYGPTGFTTMRWAEAASACLPAFIPIEFQMDEEFGGTMNELGAVVSSGEELLDKYDNMSDYDWIKIAEAQQAFVTERMLLRPWFEKIESFIGGNDAQIYA